MTSNKKNEGATEPIVSVQGFGEVDDTINDNVICANSIKGCHFTYGVSDKIH